MLFFKHAPPEVSRWFLLAKSHSVFDFCVLAKGRFCAGLLSVRRTFINTLTPVASRGPHKPAYPQARLSPLQVTENKLPADTRH